MKWGNRQIAKMKKVLKKRNSKTVLVEVINWINHHRTELKLIIHSFHCPTVNNYCNETPFDNDAIIRNKTYLTSKIKLLQFLKEPHAANRIKHAKNNLIRSDYSLLLIDPIVDENKRIKTLLHELNAWLLAECGDFGSYGKAKIKDWHHLIDKSQLRKLDEYYEKHFGSMDK